MLALLAIATVFFQVALADQEVGYRNITEEETALLAAWTPESKQSMWEISGQYEGDMILEPDQRNGITDSKRRWRKKDIPYEFSKDFDKKQKALISKSLSSEFGKTCIRPRPKKSGDRDYIYITGKNTGCHSYVGRKGGKQILNLQKSGCLYKGIIAHQFLHAVGFFHQHSVPNRDKYVTIVWKNIEKRKRNNFSKQKQVDNFGKKYDYGSVMHYSAYAFPINPNKPTIIPKKSVEIGQRRGLSRADIIKANKMFNC